MGSVDKPSKDMQSKWPLDLVGQCCFWLWELYDTDSCVLRLRCVCSRVPAAIRNYLYNNISVVYLVWLPWLSARKWVIKISFCLSCPKARNLETTVSLSLTLEEFKVSFLPFFLDIFFFLPIIFPYVLLYLYSPYYITDSNVVLSTCLTSLYFNY